MSSVPVLQPRRPATPAKPVNVAVPDLSQTLLLKGGSLFVVAGRDGDIDARRNREHGLYFHDTRYLDCAVLRLNGRRPVTLKATALRYLGRLRHIPVGTAHKNRRVRLLVAGPDVRVITDDGELIRALTIDPMRNYQPLSGRWPAHNVVQQAGTMS